MMTAVAARHGALNGQVINAGVAPQTSLDALNTETYDQLMDVNVKGATFTFARAAAADKRSVLRVCRLSGGTQGSAR